MFELAEIREVGITLQVISEWTPWSPCEHCVRNRGIKRTVGNCRLKRQINMVKTTNCKIKKDDLSYVSYYRRLLPTEAIHL